MNNKKYFIFFSIVIIASFNFLICSAQSGTIQNLLGCWKLERMEFLKQTTDSLELANKSKGYITCFEENGKFITEQQVGNILKRIGTGSYFLDKDKKTIHQRRDIDDEGNDLQLKIKVLSSKEMCLEADNVLLHFTRN